ncbi:hypothetical protein JCM10207_002120 [Rhodosporidiobolus poonsookiae]
MSRSRGNAVVRDLLDGELHGIYHAFKHKTLEDERAYHRWRDHMSRASSLVDIKRVEEEVKKGDNGAIRSPADLPSPEDSTWFPAWRDALHRRITSEDGRNRDFTWAEASSASGATPTEEDRLTTARKQILATAPRRGPLEDSFKDFCRKSQRIIKNPIRAWSQPHREAVLEAFEGMPEWIRQRGVVQVATGLASQPPQTEHSLAALAAWHRRLGYRQSAIYGISREAFARGF